VSNAALSTIWLGSTGAPSPQALGAVGPSALAAANQIVFSDPVEIDMLVYRGDSGRFRVSVSTPDGTPMDITAATWDCDIRSTVDAADVMATLDVTLVPVTIDTIEVVLTAVQSEGLAKDGVWDLEMTLGIEVQTLIRGAVLVRKDVSR
jgi:hypothetical protein